MSVPIREQILAAAAARCAGITVAAGYRQTVVEVSRKLQYLDQFAEFPVILVLPHYPADERIYDELGDGLITAVMGVIVVMYAQTTGEDLLPATLIENLREDVETVLTTPDLHLGLDPDVTDIRATGESDGEEVITADWHRIWAADLYRVEFGYSRGNA